MKRKILVAYDGSELSEEALQEAKLQAAGIPETEVHVVVVVTQTGPSTNVTVAKNIQYEVADSLRPDMERIYREFETESIPIYTEIIIADTNRNAGVKVCEYADERDIDLIIAGSRGLGTVKKMLLGSVSNQIVQEANCPVLIIK
ncbi:universal stress protein UspA [Lentibacillus kapialis]|uniref:Universal stress protein UspA n=1 Tax=Lentibacillus kapialis TaxID=340214 RepID=A0A917UVH9_9BACI|nr:universal stress protein [Lentibacillus kapialis]GGJ88416.1 universal stress protein UspA [Lentibacillus kapialis]